MRILRLLLTGVLAALLVAVALGGAGYALWRVDANNATGAPGAQDPAALASPSASPADRAVAPAQPVAASPDPLEPAIQFQSGDRGKGVRELQFRLYQLAWFPELTTGAYDAPTAEAVRGFQAKRGLPSTGDVDDRTWKVLVDMTKKPTHDQLFNILHPGPSLLASGASGESVRDLQARLVQVQWLFGDISGSYDAATVEAVRGFQAKRRIPVTGAVDQRTLDRLTAMTVTPTYEQRHNIRPEPGALDPRCTTGRALCIDKAANTLRWVVGGEVVATYDVRFGSDELPTREGQFAVFSKSRDHVSSLYDTSMPFAMFFSGGQAVHYSPDFAAHGYSGASHGCVNVRDYNGMAWLFDEVAIGDKVIVYWS